MGLRKNYEVPVHPRACGEHDNFFCFLGELHGSSPRLRGTRQRVYCRADGGRFIPAPAGNTFPPPFLSRSISVHPRACGEHLNRIQNHGAILGSSPRLRGTHSRIGRQHVKRRFIPAPAGNTWVEPFYIPCISVHPRACGEHRVACTQTLLLLGSSPRLRGTLSPSDLSLPWSRFIPAPAGNTRLGGPDKMSITVHPRACGEHSASRTARPDRCGSSPRLRGTLLYALRSAAVKRFIPAPAGNT